MGIWRYNIQNSKQLVWLIILMLVCAILLQANSFQSSAWSGEKFYHIIYIKIFSRLYTYFLSWLNHNGPRGVFGKDRLGWDLANKGKIIGLENRRRADKLFMMAFASNSTRYLFCKTNGLGKTSNRLCT